MVVSPDRDLWSVRPAPPPAGLSGLPLCLGAGEASHHTPKLDLSPVAHSTVLLHLCLFPPPPLPPRPLSSPPLLLLHSDSRLAYYFDMNWPNSTLGIALLVLFVATVAFADE